MPGACCARSTWPGRPAAARPVACGTIPIGETADCRRRSARTRSSRPPRKRMSTPCCSTRPRSPSAPASPGLNSSTTTGWWCTPTRRAGRSNCTTCAPSGHAAGPADLAGLPLAVAGQPGRPVPACLVRDPRAAPAGHGPLAAGSVHDGLAARSVHARLHRAEAHQPGVGARRPAGVARRVLRIRPLRSPGGRATRPLRSCRTSARPRRPTSRTRTRSASGRPPPDPVRPPGRCRRSRRPPPGRVR